LPEAVADSGSWDWDVTVVAAGPVHQVRITSLPWINQGRKHWTALFVILQYAELMTNRGIQTFIYWRVWRVHLNPAPDVHYLCKNF
jgi:hypothetical protein